MQKLKLASLLIAILVPVMMVAAIAYDRASAPTYKVRIDGYDPRDLLYGHYLVFRFAPDKSAQRQTFPQGFHDALVEIEGRYYIPERHAKTLEAALLDHNRVMEIEVGLPVRGKAFMGDLYIDGRTMRDFLTDLEQGVDLDGNAER